MRLEPPPQPPPQPPLPKEAWFDLGGDELVRGFHPELAGEIEERGGKLRLSCLAFDQEMRFSFAANHKIDLSFFLVPNIMKRKLILTQLIQGVHIFEEMDGDHIFKTCPRIGNLGPVPQIPLGLFFQHACRRSAPGTDEKTVEDPF